MRGCHWGSSRRARFVRWLGFDRNPMRRPADRIESVLRLMVLILLVAGVPLAAVTAGRAVDHWGLRQAQAQRSEELVVRAILTVRATSDTDLHPYSNVPMAWVAARWTAPDGSVHHGQVLAPEGAQAVSTVAVWIDRSGALTAPPMASKQIYVDVAIAVMAAAELLPLLLIGLLLVSRHFLDLKRMKAWSAEWGTTGPQWSRHKA
jgi:hypothetical protein